MCLGIAGQIIEILREPRDLARVSVFGSERVINIGMVEKEGLACGDWVLIHVGFAIAKMQENEAKASMEFSSRGWVRRSPMKLPPRMGRRDMTKTNSKTKTES